MPCVGCISAHATSCAGRDHSTKSEAVWRPVSFANRHCEEMRNIPMRDIPRGGALAGDSGYSGMGFLALGGEQGRRRRAAQKRLDRVDELLGFLRAEPK